MSSPADDEAARAAAARALLGSGGMARWLTPTSESRIERIAVRDIADREWPRPEPDDDVIDALTHSIAGHGIVEPLLLRHTAAGFEVVSGARRLRVARTLGLPTVPAIVRDIDSGAALVAALSATAGRRLLGTSEFDEIVARLVTEGLEHDEAVALVSASQPQSPAEFVVQPATPLARTSRFRDLAGERPSRPPFVVLAPPRARELPPAATAALIATLTAMDPATVLDDGRDEQRRG